MYSAVDASSRASGAPKTTNKTPRLPSAVDGGPIPITEKMDMGLWMRLSMMRGQGFGSGNFSGPLAGGLVLMGQSRGLWGQLELD